MSLILFFLDGYCQYRWIRCYSNSMSLTDMVFVESYFYNKMEFLVFNSTVGRYVGYSDYGKALAREKNEDEHLLPYERGSVDRLCKVNALVYKSHGMDKTSEYRILIPVFFQFLTHKMFTCGTVSETSAEANSLPHNQFLTLFAKT